MKKMTGQALASEEIADGKRKKFGTAYDVALYAASENGKRMALHDKVVYAAFEPAKEFGRHMEAMIRSRFNLGNTPLRTINEDRAD
jgi:hypothetical protein